MSEEKKTPKVVDPQVCIYHDPCTDGFGSAWACYTRFGEYVDYFPGNHAINKDDEEYWVKRVRGKRVVVFDWSFPRWLTEKLHDVAESFQIIDHHISTQKELGDLDYCYFDLDKSGAMLAWEACRADEPPTLIEHVQDQDLGRWKLDDSRSIAEFINSQPRDFMEWNKLYLLLEDERGFREARMCGRTMRENTGRLAMEIAADHEVWQIAGHRIIAANCPRVMRQPVCEALETLGNYPFVGCYELSGEGLTWSLRANRGTEDVSEVAIKFKNGGGHPRAAGFTVPLEEVDLTNRSIG